MVYSDFKIKVIPCIDKKNKKVSFNFTISVNGLDLNSHRIVDIYNILSFVINEDKDYVYFWNCDCGEPGCANIEECKVKNINNEDVVVIIPVPCSTNDLDEKSYDYWMKNHKKFILKTTRKLVAKELWWLSFELEKKMLELTKDYHLENWPTDISYRTYEWAPNLPIFLRKKLIKNGFNFQEDL